MIDPKTLTSNIALQTAKDAVTLVRSGTATEDQLNEAIVNLSVIVVMAVDTITELQMAMKIGNMFSKPIDTEGHEVPGNGDVN